MDFLWSWVRALLAAGGVLAFGLAAVELWSRRRQSPGRHGRYYWQAFKALLFLGAVFLFVVVAPLHPATRGHVLNLLGILLSAILALASPTVVSNALSGLVLRWQRAFHHGDFLAVDGKLGRVAQIGLFQVELQDEERNTVVYPNAYLLSHPFVVYGQDTLVSAQVSLGYDVAHQAAEKALLEAAERVGLSEPFVFVSSLGNDSVTYRVFGFLGRTRYLLQVRSELNKALLDTLHGAGIEVVSPLVVAERVLQEGQRLVPSGSLPQVPEQPAPEEVVRLMFERAERAESAEELALRLEKIRGRMEAIRKERAHMADSARRSALDSEFASLEAARRRLEEALAALTGRDDETP